MFYADAAGLQRTFNGPLACNQGKSINRKIRILQWRSIELNLYTLYHLSKTDSYSNSYILMSAPCYVAEEQRAVMLSLYLCSF